MDRIRSGLLFKMGTVKQQSNRLSSRNDWSQIAGFLQQYYEASLAIAQGIGDGALVQAIAQNALLASTEAMRQLLETFDVRNIDRITLGGLLESMQREAANGGALQGGSQGNTLGAGNPGAGGTNQGNGVDAFSQIVTALGR